MTGRGLPIGNQVLEVIEWCERNGCIKQLVEGAVRFSPQNPELQAFIKFDRPRVAKGLQSSDSLARSSDSSQTAIESQGRTSSRRLGAPPLIPPLSSETQALTSVRQQNRSTTPIYAPIHGIIVGVMRCDEVCARLGEPSWDLSSSKQVAVYAGYGLRITFDDSWQDPYVVSIHVNAALSQQLPFGLRSDMLRPEWDGVLRRVYGPPVEGDSILSPTYQPGRGVEGNAIRVIPDLPDERIGTLVIFRHYSAT